jgi:hypothetical protein
MICKNIDAMGFGHLFAPLDAFPDTAARAPVTTVTKRPKPGYPTEKTDLTNSRLLGFQSQPFKSGPSSMIFKHISILTGWAHGLAERHQNCRRIPVELVLRMCIRMLQYVSSSNT